MNTTMNTAGAKNQRKKIEEILKKISSMSNQEYTDWIKSVSKFHNYSLMNQILIWLSGGVAVMGARQWQERYNRKVKPDQYRWPIWILAPRVYKYKKTLVNENGEEEEKEIKGLRGFKCVRVYDIEQTTGPDLPSVMTKEVKTISLDDLLAIANKLNFSVSYEKMEYNCGGYITGDHGRIVINSLHNEPDQIGTLIHELSHGLLKHHDKEKRGDLTKDIIECEAETLTHLIADDFGVDRQSIFYLKSWGMSGKIMESFEKISSAYTKFKKVYAEITKQNKIAVA